MWNNDTDHFAFIASIIWQDVAPLFESGIPDISISDFFLATLLDTLRPSIGAVCRAIDFEGGA
jgi:hypothetical protein